MHSLDFFASSFFFFEQFIDAATEKFGQLHEVFDAGPAGVYVPHFGSGERHSAVLRNVPGF
jgi:hypothetical protein